MARLRSYLAKSAYNWIVDHGFTPYLLVDALQEGVEVPADYIDEGKIILNATPQAVRDFEMTDQFVSFSATFGGDIEYIYIPTDALMAVYALENNQGIFAREHGLGMMVNEGVGDEHPDPTIQATPEAQEKTKADHQARAARARFKVIRSSDNDKK